ncbi:MAG: type I secretion C-terminal target domain-containing protein, partial [Gammaproteobacteria bacterium]
VTIDSVSGGDATIGTASASTTLDDAQSAPVVSSISNVNAAEGDDLVFSVSLSNAADSTQTYSFSVSNVTTNDSDYGAAIFSAGVINNGDGTITVPAGVTTFTVTVAGVEDAVLEGDETFNLNIGGVDAIGTISNDDAAPVIDLDTDDSSGATGSSYTTTFTEGGTAVSISEVDIVVTDVDSTQLQGATITITNVEAGDLLNVGGLPVGIAASAYDPVTGSISLSGNASLADYQVAIRAIQFTNDGSSSGSSRAIEVTVTDGSNNSNTAVTTVNLQTLPTVSISDVSVQEPAAGTVALVFTISLDQALASDLTFDYSTADISALAGTDYVASATSGTILAGATSTTVTVTVNSDANNFEGDETFSLDLSNFNQTVNFASGSHLTAGGAQGIGTIGANDGVPDAVDDSYITQVDTPLVIGSLLDNDSLLDGAVLTSFTQGANGTLVDNGDGTYTYTPTTGFGSGGPETDTFTYTLTDADGETDTATVTIIVSDVPVNPPLVSAVPDTVYTENDVAIPLLSGVSVSDVDSTTLGSMVVRVDGYISGQDSLTYIAAGTSITGTIAVNGNSWELTLTGGTDINEYQQVLASLEYENLSDNPSTAVRTITVEAYDDAYNNLFGADIGRLSITAQNDAPDVFDNNQYSVASTQDNALNITAPTDVDTDDAVLVITVTGLPITVGTVTLANGTAVNLGDTLTLAQLTSLQFDANATDGTEVFSYTVSDGEFTTVGTTTINVGSTEADVNTVYESALPDGSGVDVGSSVVTGNLIVNDGAADATTTLDSIDFAATNYTPDVNGIISVTTPLGTLTVYADNSNPGFVAGDYEYVLNTTDTSSADVSESFTYHFNNGTAQQDDLTITIIDDQPVANDLVEDIPESEENVFNIMFTLDRSGSMAWGAVTGDTTPDGEPTRMEIAQQSLAALAAEYFNQSTQVTITLLTFSDNASLVGTYDNFIDFETALNNVGPDGGTNYIGATDEIQVQLAADLAVQDPADNVQNISYFISDGEANAGTSPIGSGYIEFANNNSIDSYSVGIGSGLPGDLSDLNYIHNIDSLGQGGGHVDDALIVADLSQLEAELLSTVPTAFGGNIVANGSIENLTFGADGGHVQSIEMDLGSPATTYTFNYDGNTITVTPALVTAEIDGSRLTLNADDGFDYGTFTFDFNDGSYMFVAPSGTAGNTFNFDYTIIDGDNDAASGTATINIIDDSPEARDDLHSVEAYETAAGNVINAIGTDGGPTYGDDFTPFSTQGGGVDKIVDDAVITEFTYMGSVISLDPPTTTSTIMPPDPMGSTADVATNDTFTATDFALSSVNGVGFNNAGAGIAGGRANSTLDDQDAGALTITFNSSSLPYGVDNLVLTMNDYQAGNNDAVTMILYDVTGSVISVVMHSAADGTSIDLAGYSGIGSVDIAYSGTGWDAQLSNVAYDPTPASPIEVVTLDQTSGDNGSNLSWVYSRETDIDGNDVFQATVTNSDDGSTFVMRSNGHYEYTPDQTGAPIVTTISESFTDGSSDQGIVVTSTSNGNPVITYNGVNGIGVNSTGDNWGDSADSGDNIILTFDSILYPYGVEEITMTFGYDAGTGSAIFYDDLGGVIDTVALTGNDTQTFSGITGVYSMEITTGADGDFSISQIDFTVVPDPVVLPDTQLPILVDYLLTDTDGQSDTARLSIYTIDQTIAGTIGADNIIGSVMNDAINGDTGNDILSGGEGHDTVSGGEGSDTLYGNAGNDYLSGGNDNDSLFGGAGTDYLDGDAGNDLVDGGTGDDIVQGGAGDDMIYGGAGDDLLEGEAGADALFGGAGDDTLLGGSDIDILKGGVGNDTLTGGDDSDQFVWSAGDEGTIGVPASDVITDFTVGVGGDVLNLADLLQGEESNPLDHYLHFDSVGSDTIVSINAVGGDPSVEFTQQITLSGVDLTEGGSYNTDQAIIDNLLANGNLIVDM